MEHILTSGNETIRDWTQSPELLARGIETREETPDDFVFLEALYVSVRWMELEHSGWTNHEKIEFLKSQHALQYRHYHTYYLNTTFQLLVHDTTPIGRLYLDRGRVEYRIVDVSLVPSYRGHGIGTAILHAILAEATMADCRVSIHVEKFNPAQHLYRRLGFVECSDDGPYWRMEWHASGISQSDASTIPVKCIPPGI